jgi:hypothetical protein
MKEPVSPVTRKEQKQIDLGNMVVVNGILCRVHPDPTVAFKRHIRRVEATV